MKLIHFLLLPALFCLLSFTVINYEPKNSTAEVIHYQGIYVFFASKPVKETVYLGTVKVSATWSSESTSRLNAVIKKCKKDFPTAEAVVFNEIDFESADAFTFKK